MKQFFLYLAVVFLFAGCNSKSKLTEEIEQIPVDVEIVRFDELFANATVDELPELKLRYPLFFPERFHDSIWEQRVTDTLQMGLNREVLRAFPSEEKIEEPLVSLFQHISYYFPGFTVPRVYTTTSDVDYKTRVIAADSLLILELDTYLGADHFYYEGISRYIAANLRPEMIPSDVASAYTRQYVDVPRQRHLLAQMVYFGKELYLKDLWLPGVTDADKIGYSEEQLLWAKENEIFIWSYFVERELLYSNDAKLSSRFINPAPFSKFKLELDNESPGMIGRYIGWQMVRAYMENNDVSLEQLMIVPPEELFNNSKYKPKR
ncbi:MAG: gliding motility lipoprotein GldB [Bacteroidota bacterium]